MALNLIVVAVFVVVAAWRGAAAVRTGRDARRHGWARLASVGWAISALAWPAWYWQRARLGRLAPAEAEAWMQAAADRHRLARVVNVRCPLCDAEIEEALTVTAGRLAIRPGAKCPRCDFRLDACRHCGHFQPAQDGIGGQADMTHGRCKVYRATQPVGEVYPDMARRLRAMGYDALNAPKRILDSYVPLDECTSFALDLERLRRSRVKWLGRERAALVRSWRRRAGGQ